MSEERENPAAGMKNSVSGAAGQSPAAEYNENAIQTLSALEHIRLRPGMYIGRMGDGSHPDDGIYILLKEIIDNSIDEFIMGQGRRIDVALNGHTVSVRDYGRGIPPGKLVECVSVINTGGKYNTDVFKFSIGLNGVGTKAVNALSEYFRVKTIRDGHFRAAEFSKGKLVNEEEGDCQERNGTQVEFTPDHELFKNYDFRMEYLEKRLWMYAYLNSGLSLYFNNRVYFSRNGLKDLLENEVEEENRLYNTIYFKDKTIEFALTHSDAYGETQFSFVNGQYTHDGGTHLSAFKEGVLKGINEFSGRNFKADAIRDGLVGAIAVKVVAPVFESQTKNKLGNTDVRYPVVTAVSAAVADFLHKNREVADLVIDKVTRNEQLHKQISEVKKKSRETLQKSRLRIPKLKDCKYHIGEKIPRNVAPGESMIFLTEGDSAAGSLEVCRDVNYQAIFALRGKPMNFYGQKFEKIYSNEELTFLMQALGVEESVENLRYDRIIIATDADVDGLHIRNLLLTFFLTFFDQLVLSGHVFVLETPLFRVQKPKEKPIYCYSEQERDAAYAKAGKKAEITRFKGLGEISPKEFGQFIGSEMRLAPVTLDSMRNVPELLGFYMGNNTPERKDYIMNNLEVPEYD